MNAGGRTKALVKRVVKHCAMIPGRFMRAEGFRILTYHSVGERSHGMNVRPGDFEQQMEWLARNVRVLPLGDVVTTGAGIAITFDDGYRDNLTYAAPVLHRLNIPATFFVVPGRMGQMLDHDTDPRTSTLMTGEEVRELESMGFTIGCHTLSHRRLSLLDEQEQREEIIGGTRLLAGQLGHTVEAFAYPFGSASDYNASSVRLVREAGFRYAVSNRYGVNHPGYDPWTLRRIWIDSTDTLAMFCAKVEGRLDVLSALDSTLGLHLRNFLNQVLDR